MELRIECPNCHARINITKQIEGFIVEQSQEKASRLLKEQLPKAADAVARKARLEERRRSRREMAEKEKKNKTLSQQLAALKGSLEHERHKSKERLEARAESLAESKIAGLRKSYQEDREELTVRISELESQNRRAKSDLRKLQVKFLDEGSAQRQGIIAEEDLYQHLKKHLTSDRCTVEKRGQGRKGTDVIVYVHENGERLGAIVIEVKWTDGWKANWPDQAWRDMQKHHAQFAYIAAKPSAFPPKNKDLKEAGFGLAPSPRAGMKVWVVDRSNLPLVTAILWDTVDKIVKLAETKALYGASSEAVKQLNAYLEQSYETDLREKARQMSIAVKSLNVLQEKTNSECDKAREALWNYWVTEKKQHTSITGCFGKKMVKALPRVTFAQET